MQLVKLFILKPIIQGSIFILYLFFSFIGTKAFAQITLPASPAADTLRQIEIIQGNSLRKKMVDSITYQTIAGNVIMKETPTLFYCDSASINERSKVMEAFGNVHINQNDSIQHSRKLIDDGDHVTPVRFISQKRK